MIWRLPGSGDEAPHEIASWIDGAGNLDEASGVERIAKSPESEEEPSSREKDESPHSFPPSASEADTSLLLEKRHGVY